MHLNVAFPQGKLFSQCLTEWGFASITDFGKLKPLTSSLPASPKGGNQPEKHLGKSHSSSREAQKH